MVFPTACSFLDLAESDQTALDSLRDAGSDFSKIHPFDFYIYHNNQSGAQKICEELELDGFQVSVQEGATEGDWLCLARLKFIPSIEKLSELQVVFEDLIAKFGGEYDGWETIVIPE
jgi:regulator of RNase E activity RraB